MRHVLKAFAALGLIAACSGEPPASGNTSLPASQQAPPPADVEGERTLQPEMDALDRMEDTCAKDDFRRYLGQASGDIPQDALPPRARIVGPDTRVTMDFSAERLNILTDENGMVIGFRCG